MRHINKDFDNTIARDQLESQEYKNDVLNSVLLRNGNYSSARYGHKIVRDELRDIYFDKCAYCESKIKPVSTPHIEHFRPKKKITGINNSGYYWLGYEWSNLLLACPSCNGIKSTKFPVNNENHITDHPIDANGDIDYTKFDHRNGYHRYERALIINPEYWKPEKLISLSYNGELIPIKNNKLAITTIEKIDLNRHDLLIERTKVIDNIIQRIEEQLFRRFEDNLDDNAFQNQLNIIFKDIIIRIGQEAEYTLVGRNMIEKFDELILEDIEPEFQEEIFDYFVEFLRGH
ncbi:HNH endonuclease [uncultured Christiangramia sp.]|uniref:HNH endonuclease n=1 Tax=uncultured Christiangramia sp. TaxID=503836 RepID=UPI00261867A9|nr:HNH endonuclease [uncultured Christiangramia sp.]